jgi:hypothetical protein
MTSPSQPRQPGEPGPVGEPGPLGESGSALLADAAALARRYLARLGDRAVGPSPEAVLALEELEFPLPETGLEPARVLAALDDVGSPATVASAGPRYFGFVTGGAWPIAVAASWLLAAWDQNTALSVMSPVATRLDAVAIRWVCQLLGLPAETSGGFVSGASMANATCLAAGGLDILNEVRLNQVVAACDDAEATDRMIAALQSEGTCWCGPTTWHGRRAMRVSISNWSTTQADVDRGVAAVLAAAQQAGHI